MLYRWAIGGLAMEPVIQRADPYFERRRQGFFHSIWIGLLEAASIAFRVAKCIL
ncbi:MAG: hypothetical protein R2875_03640 [Desulfobacterales bacterium]